MTGHIRTLAVAVCRSGDRVLVERGRDGVKGEDYYRAIGGGVAFGERAVDAVAREWREELDLALESPTLLGVLESLFTYEGRAGHEIVFVYAARLSDAGVEARDDIVSIDGDGVRHEAVWVTLDALRRGPTPLYPGGVLDLLTW